MREDHQQLWLLLLSWLPSVVHAAIKKKKNTQKAKQSLKQDRVNSLELFDSKPNAGLISRETFNGISSWLHQCESDPVVGTMKSLRGERPPLGRDEVSQSKQTLFLFLSPWRGRENKKLGVQSSLHLSRVLLFRSTAAAVLKKQFLYLKKKTSRCRRPLLGKTGVKFSWFKL